MFVGQYERTLDDKGRVAIPPDLREGLGAGPFLAHSFDGCLALYTRRDWEPLALALDDMVDLRYEARKATRQVFGRAVSCAVDRQGRISIPPFLREAADLRGNVILVGAGKRVEIWNARKWRAEQRHLDMEEPLVAALSRSLG